MRVLKINENFFSKPNILNSYWAGLLNADGCVQNGCKYNTRTYYSIRLKLKDKKQVEKFKKDLKSQHKISKRETFNKKFTKSNGKAVTYEIQLPSKKLVNDLVKIFKVIPNKSNREVFPKLSNKLLKAYLVGYIDGDGCIIKTKKNCYNLSLLGSALFLKNVLNFLKKEYKLKTISKPTKRSDANIYRLSINSAQIGEILKDLKLINIPKLNRKWSKLA